MPSRGVDQDILGVSGHNLKLSRFNRVVPILPYWRLFKLVRTLRSSFWTSFFSSFSFSFSLFWFFFYFVPGVRFFPFFRRHYFVLLFSSFHFYSSLFLVSTGSFLSIVISAETKLDRITFFLSASFFFFATGNLIEFGFFHFYSVLWTFLSLCLFSYQLSLTALRFSFFLAAKCTSIRGFVRPLVRP